VRKSRRIPTVGPGNEPMQVRLYVQAVGDHWAAMIVADDVPPPRPNEIKGNAFFADTPEEAERLVKAHLALSEPANGRSTTVAQQGKSDELVTLQELVVSNAYEIVDLIAALERKGIRIQTEVLTELTRRTEISVTSMRSHREGTPPNCVARITWENVPTSTPRSRVTRSNLQ
jgi:hypothetical protein